MDVSNAILPVIDEATGKRMLNTKAELNKAYMEECLKLRDIFRIVKVENE
jgi:hypothetical protein